MTTISRKSNLGFKTEQAKQVLARYIWDSKLKTGDRLPSQEIIRNELGLGNATITRALNALKRDGVLATQRRKGTYVINPDADGHAGWVIGLAAIQSGNSCAGPFFSCLLHHLQTQFRSIGCETVVFYCKPTENAYGIELDYFPGLMRSVEEKRLDAVVLTADISANAWSWLEKRGMSPCYLGPFTTAPRGIFVDYQSILIDMIQTLLKQGCKKPGLVIANCDIRNFIWSHFCEITQQLREFDPKQFYFDGVGISGGHQLAQDILARSPSDRPDGLAIMDDQIASGLINELVRSRLKGGTYQPILSCLVTKQLPIDFPVEEMFRFETDIDIFVNDAVSLIMNKLKKQEVSVELVKYKPLRMSETRLTSWKTQSCPTMCNLNPSIQNEFVQK